MAKIEKKVKKVSSETSTLNKQYESEMEATKK